ncbi:MAG: 3-oxoacyl-[acyl-carrier protein] reductase [Actinomycetota bacterium]|nr:3-oxoacyl-[acyl-carrier protein] reductase [Actinomycetota bacterium]
MDLGLSDRVYIVTGAARGLGRACAEQLAAEGARLVLTADDESLLRATAASLGGPERALPVAGDLSEPGLETCLVAAAIARYGRLDGALLSVGASGRSTVMETDDGAWRIGFESLFLAPLRLCRTVATSVSHEGGSLVLLLSTSVHEPIAGFALSNGLRPGLAMASKSLSDELGPANVRVNAVLPGCIESDRPRHDSAHPDDRATPNDTIPLHRHGEPLEFARPAVFLLSPAASYVTGTALVVDGGLTRSF